MRRSRRLSVALVVVLSAVMLHPAVASAQTPVEGPWLDIFQVFWFTDTDYTNPPTDAGNTYTRNAAQRFDYSEARRAQCYYFPDTEANQVNALYWLMSCRLGLVVGAVSWIGVGIALMALTWGGVMWIVDAGSGGERGAALRNMISGPLVGLFIIFSAYIFARFAYTLIRYNVTRYLDNPTWWVGLGP